MSRILIFSDLHAHNFKEYASLNSTGQNTRLEMQLKVLSEVLSYANDPTNNIEAVFFLGDLFHARKYIHIDVYSAVYDVLHKHCKELENLYSEKGGFSVDKQKYFFLVGNHDRLDDFVNSLSSLRHVSKILRVISRCGLLYLSEWNDFDKSICLAPFTKDSLKSNLLEFKGSKILLSHNEISDLDIKNGSEYRTDAKVSYKELRELGFNRVFTGHYHLPGEFFNGGLISVGSVLAHSWSDADCYHGFVIYDTEKDIVTRVNTSAPLFLNADWTGETPVFIINPKDVGYNCYIRLKTNKTEQEIENFKQEYLDKGVLNISVRDNKQEDTLYLGLPGNEHIDIGGLLFIDSFIEQEAVDLDKVLLKKILIDALN